MLGTFRIIRARWQEVLLIVGLQAAAAFAFMQVTQEAHTNNADAERALVFAALLCATFAIVAKMLSIGFARTSFTDGPLHYEPWALLKIGYHYFWRIIGFELLVSLITASVVVGVYIIAMKSGANPEQMTQEQLSKVMIGCAAVGLLLVSKLMLFGPATIIITDCGIVSAFGWMTWMKLWHAKKLLTAYILWIAATLSPGFIAVMGAKAFVENYGVMAVVSIITGLLTLVIYVAAVKAAADVYLQTDHEENEGHDVLQTDIPENPGEGN